jgi:formylglycine-generating enzyme required for sulfatase activity
VEEHFRQERAKERERQEAERRRRYEDEVARRRWKEKEARKERRRKVRKFCLRMFGLMLLLASVLYGARFRQNYNRQVEMQRVEAVRNTAEEARQKAEREEQQRKEKETAAAEEAARQFAENVRNKKPISLPLSGDVSLELLPVPTGSFMMGSPADEPGRYNDETRHEVTISKPYWMGKYEVTQAQWEAVMGNNPSEIKGAKLPVENVSWDEAMAFCKKLTEQERTAGRLPEGYRYTLPTEAEWEYACRAGTTTPFSTGNNFTAEQGNYDGRIPYNRNATREYRKMTTEVGSFPANAFGLYDMHGNVGELCRDWDGAYPTGSVTDPTGARTGSARIARGGSWYSNARSCRSAYRAAVTSGARSSNYGFRVALSSVVGGGD